MLTRNSERRFFGAWKEDDIHDAPSFMDVVDPNWMPIDLQAILCYLETGSLISIIPTENHCHFCKSKVGSYGWQSDGVWLWRTLLAHQIKSHHVKLPNAFVDHMRAVKYNLPNVESIQYETLDWPFEIPDISGS